MPLYVYDAQGSPIEKSEKEQFRIFASILYENFKDSKDNCVFIGNCRINLHDKKKRTTVVDAILFTPRCITVIDFKAFSGYFRLRANGNWLFRQKDTDEWDAKVLHGGSGNKTIKTQIIINHNILMNFLKEKDIKIDKLYYKVSCIIAFEKIYEIENLEEGTREKFKFEVCDSDTLKETLAKISEKEILITNDEIIKIPQLFDLLDTERLDESEYKNYKSEYSKQAGKSTEKSHNTNTDNNSKTDTPKPAPVRPAQAQPVQQQVKADANTHKQQTITSNSNAVKPIIHPINQKSAQTSDTLQRPTTTASSTANAPIRPSTQQQPNSVRPVIQPTHQLEKQVSKPQAITIQKETKPVINTINTQDSKAKKNHDDYILGLPDSQFSFERYKNSDLYFLRVKHIDGSIECLTKPIFREEGSSFHNGLSTVSMQDYKSYFINKLGNPVSKGYDFHSIMPFGEIYRMSQSCRYGLLNKVGNEIAPARYDIIKAFNCGVAVFRINKKYGVISDSGKELVRPMYDYISPFNNDVAVVCLDHKCGVINTSGKTVVPIAHYDYISKFEDGVASAKIGTKWGVIDTSGKVVVPVMYDGIHECTSKGSIVINNLWNLSLNSKGAIKSKKISISDFLEYTICGATIVHIICLILLYLLCTGIVNWQDQFLHLSSVNKLVYTSLFIIEFVTIIINSLFVLPEYNGDRGGGYIGENASPIICIIPFVGFLIIVWLILLAITYYMGSFDYCDVIRDICTFVTPIALIVMNIYAFWDEWKCNRKWYLRRAEYDPNC